jgi:hypothetical protein
MPLCGGFGRTGGRQPGRVTPVKPCAGRAAVRCPTCSMRPSSALGAPRTSGFAADVDASFAACVSLCCCSRRRRRRRRCRRVSRPWSHSLREPARRVAVAAVVCRPPSLLALCIVAIMFSRCVDCERMALAVLCRRVVGIVAAAERHCPATNVQDALLQRDWSLAQAFPYMCEVGFSRLCLCPSLPWSLLVPSVPAQLCLSLLVPAHLRSSALYSRRVHDSCRWTCLRLLRVAQHRLLDVNTCAVVPEPTATQQFEDRHGSLDIGGASYSWWGIREVAAASGAGAVAAVTAPAAAAAAATGAGAAAGDE